jgi:hypothetical protein
MDPEPEPYPDSLEMLNPDSLNPYPQHCRYTVFFWLFSGFYWIPDPDWPGKNTCTQIKSFRVRNTDFRSGSD